MYIEWKIITDIILLSSLAIVGVFGALGLYQWISRKSIKKVDKQLLRMIIPLVLMAATFIICDKILPKIFGFWPTRPNGSGEPSFPSTHVMVVTTVFLLTAIAARKYVHVKPVRIILDIIMLALITLTCFGRVLADMHWVTDVIGGLVFAAIFAIIYYFSIKRKDKNE